MQSLAVGAGFEPAVPLSGTSVFETDALNHSANPPYNFKLSLFNSFVLSILTS